MTLWQQDWLDDSVRPAKRALWRGVEAQHVVATMRLVDDLAEQELLEELLEGSKPNLPPEAGGRHYLLTTPFRYATPWASRFRQAFEPGAWYGADEPRTVAAETAYWRWRFFVDSDGLRDEQVMAELTFFQAKFMGTEVDLTVAPWVEHRTRWRDPADYSSCHALAACVRQLPKPVQSIRYESARLEGAACQVVFDVQALRIANPDLQQTWVCKTTKNRVMLSHEAQHMQFEMASSSASP